MVQQLHIMEIGTTGTIDGAIIKQIKNYKEMIPFDKNKKNMNYDTLKSKMKDKGYTYHDSETFYDYGYNIKVEEIAKKNSLYNYLYEEKEIGKVTIIPLLNYYEYDMFMFIIDNSIWTAIKEVSMNGGKQTTKVYYFYKVLVNDNRTNVKQMIKLVGKDNLKAKVKNKEGITAEELIYNEYGGRGRITLEEYKGKKEEGQLAYTYNKSGKKYLDIWATNDDEDLGLIWYGKISSTIVEKDGKAVDEKGKEVKGKTVSDIIKEKVSKTGEKSKEFTSIKVATSNNDKGEARDSYTYKDVLTDSGASYFSQSVPSDVNPKFNTKVSKILGVIQVIGSVISVLSLVLLGIKYMVGSVEEKADYKKELPIYALGAIMVFAISNLLSIIYNWATKIS